MSNMNKAKQHPLTFIGSVLMVMGVVVSLSDLEASGDVMQFLAAAAPFVLLGLGVACTLAGAFAGQKKDQ